jgi:hypothetical protein
MASSKSFFFNLLLLGRADILFPGQEKIALRQRGAGYVLTCSAYQITLQLMGCTDVRISRTHKIDDASFHIDFMAEQSQIQAEEPPSRITRSSPRNQQPLESIPYGGNTGGTPKAGENGASVGTKRKSAGRSSTAGKHLSEFRMSLR